MYIKNNYQSGCCAHEHPHQDHWQVQQPQFQYEIQQVAQEELRHIHFKQQHTNRHKKLHQLQEQQHG